MHSFGILPDSRALRIKISAQVPGYLRGIITMKLPKVSVAMPVYNGGRYLAGAIESILTQTFSDFEFLIVDDGSTDRSLSIMQHYAGLDGRIRLFSRPNTGIAGALNEMLSRARAEL